MVTQLLKKVEVCVSELDASEVWHGLHRLEILQTSRCARAARTVAHALHHLQRIYRFVGVCPHPVDIEREVGCTAHSTKVPAAQPSPSEEQMAPQAHPPSCKGAFAAHSAAAAILFGLSRGTTLETASTPTCVSFADVDLWMVMRFSREVLYDSGCRNGPRPPNA